MVRPSRRGRPRPLSGTEWSTGVVSGDDVDWTTSPYTDPTAADQWKQPCRVATTASITIATALNNGDTLDGVTLAAGDRVLVKDQGTASQNGIYIVGTTPERAPDMDDDDEVLGAVVYVIDGTTNAATAWKVTNTAAVTVDTTAIVFAAFGTGGASFGTPANTYGTPAAGAASTAVRTDAVLPGPPIVILTLTNKSGGSVAAGDVVVIDTANDGAFTTTTTGRAEVSVGIAQATIANNASGAVLVSGYAALVNVPASVTRGHYVETHTVAKQATGNSSRRSGSFGQFLTGGTTPTAWLWGSTDQTASGSGAVATDTIWDTKGDLAVATGADAASKLAVGTDGYVLTADSSQSTGVKWAAASSGGITLPSIVQYVQSTTTATSVTIAAAASGRSLLLISDSTTGQITSVACTNVTWTQLKTFTSGGGSYYALWVGSVAGGSSGTSVTWTKPGSFATIMVMEIADTLTRTLGASTSGNNNTTLTISPTSGHFVVMGGGSDNTTQASGAAIGNLVALTTGPGFTTIAVAYATSAGKAFGSVGGAAGGGVLCEVT